MSNSTAREFLLDEARKAAARWLFTAVAVGLILLFTPLWRHLQGVWNSGASIDALRAENAAQVGDLRADIAALVAQVAAMQVVLDRATGEDRVIRQTWGLSYVVEPVHLGEPVVLYLVAARTLRGASCRLLEYVPLYVDEGGVAVAGVPTPAARQIGTDPTRLRMTLPQPPGLRPGRIELHLALDYDCNGARVPDRTDPVTFRLLEARP
jgi:hypothetical protein